MIDINPYTLLGGIIFSLIGWGTWRFGRSMERTKPMVIGIALMLFPYFFSNLWLLWGIGIALLVTLYFHHD